MPTSDWMFSRFPEEDYEPYRGAENFNLTQEQIRQLPNFSFSGPLLQQGGGNILLRGPSAEGERTFIPFYERGAGGPQIPSRWVQGGGDSGSISYPTIPKGSPFVRFDPTSAGVNFGGWPDAAGGYTGYGALLGGPPPVSDVVWNSQGDGDDFGSLLMLASLAAGAYGLANRGFPGFESLSNLFGSEGVVAEAGGAGMGAGYGAVEPTVSAATGTGGLTTGTLDLGRALSTGTNIPFDPNSTSRVTGDFTKETGMEDIFDFGEDQWLRNPIDNISSTGPGLDDMWGMGEGYGAVEPTVSAATGSSWLDLVKKNGLNIAKMLFGGGSEGTGGSGTGGSAKGGYQFPWENVIASILSNRSLDKYRSDLLGVMNKAIDKADPFAAERPRYQSQLRDLTTTPSNFLKDPGIADLMNYEGEATGRDLASKGYNMSGNFAKEVAEARNRTAFQNYLPYVDQISKNAGAYFGPSNAGTLASTLGAEGAKAGLNERGYLGNIIGDISRGRQPTSGTGNKNLFDWITESF